MKTKSTQSANNKYSSYTSIRSRLTIIFSCLTAIPFVVFTFIYFQIGAFSTALSGFLLALCLVLVLEGFIIFRRTTENIEQLSSTMINAEKGTIERIQASGDTKELAIMADTFNKTLVKLENTANALEVRSTQASTLDEITKIVSNSIDLSEIANSILDRTVKTTYSKAGYLGIKRNELPILHILSSYGINHNIPTEIDLNKKQTLISRAISTNRPISIPNIEIEPEKKPLNRPDIGLPCLIHLPIIGREAPIGVLVLGKDITQEAFNNNDIEFLNTLLQQVALSIENARLYENLKQSNMKLKKSLEFQKKAQEQLLSSARITAFGELSINIAHELNNPLTGIIGYTDFIINTPMEKDKMLEILKKIQHQASRVSKITKSFVDFGERGDGQRSIIEINETIKKALFLSKPRFLKEKIDVDLHFSKTPVSILADPAQITQVFLALISNAINAMTGAFKQSKEKDLSSSKEDKSCILSIICKVNDDQVSIIFKDTGPGISPQSISRIFEPFYSTQNQKSQVGLGLWISHRIVKAHGGNIQVESIEETGTTFEVILPSIPTSEKNHAIRKNFNHR